MSISLATALSGAPGVPTNWRKSKNDGYALLSTPRGFQLLVVVRRESYCQCHTLRFMKLQGGFIRLAQIYADVECRLNILESHIHHAHQLQPTELFPRN